MVCKKPNPFHGFLIMRINIWYYLRSQVIYLRGEWIYLALVLYPKLCLALMHHCLCKYRRNDSLFPQIFIADMLIHNCGSKVQDNNQLSHVYFDISSNLQKDDIWWLFFCLQGYGVLRRCLHSWLFWLL